MKNKSALSSSGMFLSELLIAILVFAVAAAICVKIFVFANFTVDDSSTLNRAVIAAQNGAECFKSADGNLAETAKLLGATGEAENAILLYFDKDWQGATQENALFIVKVERLSRQIGCINGQVSVSEGKKDPFYTIPVSVLEVATAPHAETEVTP